MGLGEIGKSHDQFLIYANAFGGIGRLQAAAPLEFASEGLGAGRGVSRGRIDRFGSKSASLVGGTIRTTIEPIESAQATIASSRRRKSAKIAADSSAEQIGKSTSRRVIRSGGTSPRRCAAIASAIRGAKRRRSARRLGEKRLRRAIVIIAENGSIPGISITKLIIARVNYHNIRLAIDAGEFLVVAFEMDAPLGKKIKTNSFLGECLLQSPSDDRADRKLSIVWDSKSCSSHRERRCRVRRRSLASGSSAGEIRAGSGCRFERLRQARGRVSPMEPSRRGRFQSPQAEDAGDAEQPSSRDDRPLRFSPPSAEQEDAQDDRTQTGRERGDDERDANPFQASREPAAQVAFAHERSKQIGAEQDERRDRQSQEREHEDSSKNASAATDFDRHRLDLSVCETMPDHFLVFKKARDKDAPIVSSLPFESRRPNGREAREAIDSACPVMNIRSPKADARRPKGSRGEKIISRQILALVGRHPRLLF